MASDPVDHHHLHPSDAASAADHPSTSSSPTAGHRKVKLLCSYGGQILPRAGDGSLRYVGGETRIVTLRRDATLPEVLRKMGDVYGGPALLRYQLPDQDLDPLISVSTSDDLENMMEEYDKFTADTPGAKLRVFLFPHNEVAGTGADSVAPYCALQENVTRYLDAINGLDSGIRGRDSATSFSSAHNSDGMNVSEAAINESVGMEMVINEGTFHANMCPTTISAQDALNMAFGVQDNQDVQKAYSHSNQTEVLHSIQSEWSPPGLNQNSIPNSTQAEQPSVAWHMPQFYGDSRHAQMSPQYYAVMGIPPPINVAGASQHTYVPPGHINATNETTNHPRVDSHFGNPNVGNVAKFPSDVNHHLFPKLPPLPSPHLLAPNTERNALRQVGTLSQVLTKRLDCSLCPTSLPHAHSETMISEQGIGLKTAIPEATKVLQSRHSEDLTRMRATQVPDVGMPVSKGMDTQVENLTAAPPKAYDFIETVPQMSQDSGRPVVDAASVDMAEILIAPVSMGILSASQPSTGTINNPKKSNEVHSLQKQQEGPTLAMNSDSYGHPKILLGPGSVSITQNPSGTFIIPPQSNVGDILQHQTQLLQHIGLNVFPMYPVDQDFINKSFVPDTGLVGKSEHQTDGQTMHGSETTFFHSHARPIDMTMGAVWKNPHGFPGFCDQTRPVGVPDVDTSKYVKPEQPTMVTVNTHKNGLQERGNELSVGHPLISNVAVPEGNSMLAVQPSMVSDVAYLQSVHPANTSLIPDTIGVHGPYLNHLEAGVGSRGVANYADPAYISNDFSKNPNVERKDETSNFHAVDVPIEKAIPQRDNSQFSTMHHTNKMDQLQQVFLTGSHASDKDLQNAQGATVIPPRPSNVSKKEPISTKDMHSSICPKNNKQSEIVVPTEVASSNIQNSQNMDSPKELAYTLKDLEDVNIKQDIQIYDGRASATTLQPSEVQVPVPDSYETKDTSPDKECATKESNIAVECDHTENIKNKQLEKIKNGFPNTDEIGHLQIIKNSDLEELQELGSGTFGTVYHGKWRGSDVAIKRINDRIFSGKPSEQERARADFWNEACKLASLHHPNVVAFYGIVLDGPGGSIATVTEFMVNGSLRRALQKNEKLLDRHKRLLIAMDVAFGMEYLHSKNIIHFDLKSDNLLVNLRDPQRPICKVGDLGLSKVKYETLMSGGMQGTLPWMAPELLLGKDSKYTEKVDVFSFGIVMWELLTGEEPYKGMHCGAIIGGILSDTLRPPVPETCDPDWRSLMEQCWATEPSLRPSFTEIASRLRTMSTSLPQKA